MKRPSLTLRTVVAAPLAAALIAAISGCKPTESSASTASSGSPPSTAAGGAVPSFSLAWSEYPSWSVFGVAAQVKLIDGAFFARIGAVLGMKVEVKRVIRPRLPKNRVVGIEPSGSVVQGSTVTLVVSDRRSGG